jgi:PAS domain S-box-containing protein
MTNTDSRPKEATELRKRAEEIVRERRVRSPENIESMSPAEIRRMLEDLRVHQIELEMQNEELRRTQVELDTERERYFDLYNLAPVGYCTLSEEGLILEANLTTANLLGGSRGVLVQQPISRFIFKEDQDIYYLYRKRLCETGETQGCEVRMVKSDGVAFWVRMEAIIVRNADGEPLSRVVLSDITGRKRVEEELRGVIEALTVSETRYRRLFESAKDGILILDAETGKIVDVNPFLVEMLGYSQEQFIEKSIWEIGVFKDIVANQSKFSELQQKGFVRYENLPLETADGRTINVEFISNVYSIDKKMIIQCFIRDITDRKRMENELSGVMEDLDRSNRDLQQFASIASHDLQEPLRMVGSYAQLLAKHYEDQLDEKGKKYIAYMTEGAIRMQQLVNDLLTYSRVGTHGNPMEARDSHVILGEAIMNLAILIEENKAIVTVDALPIVCADASQLVQVFQNLLANAIKFRSEEIPRIHVFARDAGHEWVFSVRDNGIGIDRQYAERIFVIFQRLHTREEYPGSGIGLAVCKRIVERHGGRIWLESEPGKGSTFFFTIPKQEKGDSK